MQIEFLVSSLHDGLRLGVFLRRNGISMSRIRSVKYIEGGLLCNGEAARTNRFLAAGDVVTVTLPPEVRFSAEPQDIPLNIVYEAVHTMAVNKPPGMVIHPTHQHQSGTLANAFAALMQQRGIVASFRAIGRLDADTSGLVLLALNALAAPMLAKNLQKVYIAFVGGELPVGLGCIEAPLGPLQGSTIKQCVSPGGRACTTNYSVLAAAPKASLVVVRPLTGRTHQIRAHFAHIQHPLLGDSLYGGNMSLLSRHALHCAAITFTEVFGDVQRLYCPVPPDMAAVQQEFWPNLPNVVSEGIIDKL